MGRRKRKGKNHVKAGGDKYSDSSFGSCSSSFASNTDEAMSASSKMAISEESWTALAKEKERNWWSIDFGGEVEELEVGGPWTFT